MTVDRIVAWLRLRDVARFRRDAWRAAQSIRGIGRAADDTGGPLNQLGGALGQLASNIPEYTGRTRIFGFAIGTVTLAFALMLPVIVAVGGALTAVTGSLAAAAIGAGLLGTAFLGAAIPLGAFGIVAMQAFQGFSKVNTAFQNWQKQVHAFGKNSTQAETALKRLNGTAAIFGGPIMIRAAKTWDDLQTSFRKANTPALREMGHMLIGILHTVKNILPLFATMTLIASRALAQAIKPLRAALESPGFRDAMMTLSNGFAQLAGPLMQSVVNFFMGFFSIASRLQGFLPSIADSIVRVSEAFRSWAASGDLNTLVGHFFSWWSLLKATGRLLFVILNTGASDGRSLVESLTAIVNKWSDWLSTAKGQDSLKKFFDDSISSAKVFIAVVAGVIKGLFWFGRVTMGPLAKGFGIIKDAWLMFMDAIKPAKPWFDTVLKPFMEGLAGGLLGAVVGAFKFLIGVIKITAIVLGFLGKKLSFLAPVFKIIGWLVGFFLGGEILRLMSWLSKVTVILRPLGLIFRALEVPIILTGKAIGFLFGWIGKLIGLSARFVGRFANPFKGAINSVLDFLTGSGSKFLDAGARIWGFLREGILRAIGQSIGLGKEAANAIIDFLNFLLPNRIPIPFAPDIKLPANPIPHLAQGGVVAGQGSWITGEAGPELNTLIGGKVIVKPLTPGIAAVSPTATLAAHEPRILVSKVYLRGKQIAEAVADEAADDLARRGKHG